MIDPQGVGILVDGEPDATAAVVQLPGQSEQLLIRLSLMPACGFRANPISVCITVGTMERSSVGINGYSVTMLQKTFQCINDVLRYTINFSPITGAGPQACIYGIVTSNAAAKGRCPNRSIKLTASDGSTSNLKKESTKDCKTQLIDQVTSHC